MMARLHLIFVTMLASLLVLGACKKGFYWSIPAKILEPIPFSPLEVDTGVETVYMDAFWENINLIDSITCSNGFHARWVKGMETLLLQTTDSAPALGKMQFWSAGYAYTLPLIRRLSRVHTFTLADHERHFAAVDLLTSFSEPRPMLFVDGNWTITAKVPAGMQAYGFQSDGSDMQPDPANKDSIFWPGLGLASLIPADLKTVTQNNCRTLAYTGTQVRMSRSAAPESILALWNNIEIPVDTSDGALRLEIPKEAQKVPISYLRVWIANKFNIEGSCKIPLIKGKIPVDSAAIPAELWDAAIRYEWIANRYAGAARANCDNPKPCCALHAGLDIQSADSAYVLSQIRDGYFRELGISFLQIAAPAETISKGTVAAFDTRYPTAVNEYETGLRSDDVYKQLLQQAEFAGLRVGLNPPSFFSQQSGIQQEPPADSAIAWFRSRNAAAWIHPGLGTSARRKAAMAGAVRRFGKEENGRNLLLAFGGDLRSRQVPASSRVSASAYNAPEFYAVAFSIFTYRAAKTSAATLMMQYLASLNNLQLRFHATGSESLPPFVSLLEGRAKVSESPAGACVISDTRINREYACSRLQTLFALCCALPGIPGICRGDEMAMPGTGFSHGQRSLRFENLFSFRKDQRSALARLAKFRRAHPTLMFGDTRIIESMPGVLVIERNYFGRSIFAVFNLRNEPLEFQVPKPLYRSFRGIKLSTNTQSPVTLTLEPNSYDFIY